MRISANIVGTLALIMFAGNADAQGTAAPRSIRFEAVGTFAYSCVDIISFTPDSRQLLVPECDPTNAPIASTQIDTATGHVVGHLPFVVDLFTSRGQAITGRPGFEVRDSHTWTALGALSHPAYGPTHRPTCVAPDGSAIGAYGLGSAAEWYTDPASPSFRRVTLWSIEVPGPLTAIATACAYSPDASIFAYALNPDVRDNRSARVALGDRVTGRDLFVIELSEPASFVGSMFMDMTFSEDGRMLATGANDGVVRVYNAERGSPQIGARIAQFSVNSSLGVPLMHAMSSERLLTTNFLGEAVMWDARRGVALWRANIGTAMPLPVILLDHQMLISFGAGNAHAYSLLDGAPIATMDAPVSVGTALVSPDERFMMTEHRGPGETNSVRLWRVLTQ